MADWHSEQYLKFAKERTQPARDLAARLTHLRPETVVDIGCGPGNSTQVLREVFPSADLFGIDSSPRMIEQARADHPNLCFRLCDASLLEGRYDLLFSNACLQWIPDHRTLLPALMGHLKDGGVLAVQMPRNGEEPLFRLIEVLAGEPHWDLRNVPGKINETLSPTEYYDILTGCASSFELWEERFFHALPDHRALVDWVKGTRLRPYLEALDPQEGAEFETMLENRARELYPVRADGKVVLGFRRLFFTAVR